MLPRALPPPPLPPPSLFPGSAHSSRGPAHSFALAGVSQSVSHAQRGSARARLTAIGPRAKRPTAGLAVEHLLRITASVTRHNATKRCSHLKLNGWFTEQRPRARGGGKKSGRAGGGAGHRGSRGACAVRRKFKSADRTQGLVVLKSAKARDGTCQGRSSKQRRTGPTGTNPRRHQFMPNAPPSAFHVTRSV